MRWIKNLGIGLTLIWAIGGCVSQPYYSITPEIKLLNISFSKGVGSSADTLTFVLKFTDGDGDLGVDGDETAIYFGSDSIDINDPYYFIYDTLQNKIVASVHSSDLNLSNDPYLAQFGLTHDLSYVDYHSRQVLDTLPPLSCKYWQVTSTQAKGQDTLYFISNPYTNNMLIDAYEVHPTDTTLIDPTTIFTFSAQCVTNVFNGRFPILSTDLGKNSPLDGTITYKVSSFYLYLLFHSKKLHFKIHITDRAFHASNIVEGDYTF